MPEDIKQGSSVKKGTVIAFTRDGQGNIEACANEHSLVKVQSQKLAQAVFDIYLGATVRHELLDCATAATSSPDAHLAPCSQ